MKIEHVAIWTLDIDKMAKFYEKYFNAMIGTKYINEKKGFESVFLTFDEGSRIELMKNQSLQNLTNNNVSSVVGYAHLAISVGNRKSVDSITSDLRSDGFKIMGLPAIVWVKRGRGRVHQSETLSHFGTARYS